MFFSPSLKLILCCFGLHHICNKKTESGRGQNSSLVISSYGIFQILIFVLCGVFSLGVLGNHLECDLSHIISLM